MTKPFALDSPCWKVHVLVNAFKSILTGYALLARVFESLPSELDEVCADIALTPFERTCAGIIRLYLQGDTDGLRAMPLSFETEKEKQILEALRQVRIAIRCLEADAPSVTEGLDVLLAEASEQTLLAGEANFVLAMYFETIGDEHKSFEHYKVAHDLFLAFGCRRRSVKSLHNSLACLTRIDPKRKLLVEYNKLVMRAKACECWGTVGAALTNMSREFQLMGLFYAALRYANDAVEVLRDKSSLSHTYFLALIHRAHVAYALNLQNLMSTDLEEASISPFPEIRSAVSSFRRILDGQPLSDEDLRFCNFTWKERLHGMDSKEKGLGELEQGVLTALTEGPKTRYELIDKIYPNGTDILALENRLKQLLHRLRRKYPGLIGKTGRHYCLLEENPITPQLVI